jgi:hypothetical protein
MSTSHAASTVPTRAAPPSPAPAARPRKQGQQEPPPVTPLAFFTLARFCQLAALLTDCADRWMQSDLTYLPFFWRDSEPFWGPGARRLCSKTTLRLVRIALLRRLLQMEIERALRLLLLDWRTASLAAEGHSSAEWQDALDGTLCRIGQVYCEFARRWKRQSEARAWEEIAETVRILLFCVTADAA